MDTPIEGDQPRVKNPKAALDSSFELADWRGDQPFDSGLFSLRSRIHSPAIAPTDKHSNDPSNFSRTTDQR